MAQIVIHTSITWISLTNNNSEIPNGASLRWAGLPQGYLYRGVAPTSTTKYHYGHTVFVPPSQAYYICTFTAGGQGIDVARADIPGHPNFRAVTPLMSDADPLAAGTAAAGTSALTSRSDHVHPPGSGEGAALSDELPVNIGPQSQQGDGAAASRDDHTHYLPHDATLKFIDGALGVSIHDVVEHLSQRIQYYTNENNYDTDGSGAGQVYNSSRYPKNLQWVKAFIRVPLGVDDAIYRAGVYRVASDNEILEVLGQSETTGIITVTGTYRFDFLAESTSALGIPLDGGERIMVLIRRIGAGNTAETGLRHGSEDDDSPNASYPDAAVDFVLANHVIVQHENPAIGQTTHSHGGGIRGNLQLGYVVIIDHGALVGDERNVNVAHIDSGAATLGQVPKADGAGRN